MRTIYKTRAKFRRSITKLRKPNRNEIQTKFFYTCLNFKFSEFYECFREAGA